MIHLKFKLKFQRNYILRILLNVSSLKKYLKIENKSMLLVNFMNRGFW